LVKDLQEKLGFEVVLWSVDTSYGLSGHEAIERCARTMDLHKITWSNVIVPGGWETLNKKFKIDGYGLFLIDKKGRVLGRELFPEDIEQALKRAKL
jgi:hypothetical protein